MIRNWKPEKVKAEILDQLQRNAADAGQFVVDDARRRLQRIQEPEWGQAYRRKVVAGLLAYEVVRTPGALEIRVGVRTTPESRHHGFYIETGSSTAPAQPYLRPAVFQQGRKIVGLLTR